MCQAGECHKIYKLGWDAKKEFILLRIILMTQSKEHLKPLFDTS